MSSKNIVSCNLCVFSMLDILILHPFHVFTYYEYVAQELLFSNLLFYLLSVHLNSNACQIKHFLSSRKMKRFSMYYSQFKKINQYILKIKGKKRQRFQCIQWVLHIYQGHILHMNLGHITLKFLKMFFSREDKIGLKKQKTKNNFSPKSCWLV